MKIVRLFNQHAINNSDTCKIMKEKFLQNLYRTHEKFSLVYIES